MTLSPKAEKIESEAYLVRVRRCRCISCGAPPPGVEAAHLRMADAGHGKPESGMGRRPGDQYVLPLCARCHREGAQAQHRANEREWWGKDPRDVTDPVGCALALYERRSDVGAMRSFVSMVLIGGFGYDRTPCSTSSS